MGAPALQIDTPWSSTDGKGVVVKTKAIAASDRVVYPADPTLALPLPQIAFTVRTHEFFELEVVVRSSGGVLRVLAYRAVDALSVTANGPFAPAVPLANGLGAVIPIGADMAAGELGTIYRDLAADLRAVFGLRFLSVEQVRVRGSLDVLGVTLASDRAPDEDTDARLSLPVAGWDKDGTGNVYENLYDPALPGPTLRSAASGLELTYPAQGRLLVRFRTLALAVRDTTTDFVVEVKVYTRAGAIIVLTYEADRTDVRIRSSGAFLPLVTSPRAASPYRDVRLDLAADFATADPDASFATIRSVSLAGRFTAGDIQLRDRSE